jgi:hypothetical protein
MPTMFRLLCSGRSQGTPLSSLASAHGHDRCQHIPSGSRRAGRRGEASGVGRELGPEGLANYQQLKSVYLR